MATSTVLCFLKLGLINVDCFCMSFKNIINMIKYIGPVMSLVSPILFKTSSNKMLKWLSMRQALDNKLREQYCCLGNIHANWEESSNGMPYLKIYYTTWTYPATPTQYKGVIGLHCFIEEVFLKPRTCQPTGLFTLFQMWLSNCLHIPGCYRM